MGKANEIFSRFTKVCARTSGHALAFSLALLLIFTWLAAGPLFHWDDTWQLTINTLTTIITFLMVFVIQNTQTRDVEAMQVKLDTLVLNTKGAKNELMALEELPEDQLRALQEEFEALGKKYRSQLRRHRRRHPTMGTRHRPPGKQRPAARRARHRPTARGPAASPRARSPEGSKAQRPCSGLRKGGPGGIGPVPVEATFLVKKACWANPSGKPPLRQGKPWGR